MPGKTRTYQVPEDHRPRSGERPKHTGRFSDLELPGDYELVLEEVSYDEERGLETYTFSCDTGHGGTVPVRLFVRDDWLWKIEMVALAFGYPMVPGEKWEFNSADQIGKTVVGSLSQDEKYINIDALYDPSTFQPLEEALIAGSDVEATDEEAPF